MGRRWRSSTLGAFSYHFWWHAVVSEMYALNIFISGGAAGRLSAPAGSALGIFVWSRARQPRRSFVDLAGFCRWVFLIHIPEFKAQRNLRVLSPRWPSARFAGDFCSTVICRCAPLARPLMNWNDPSTPRAVFAQSSAAPRVRRWFGSALVFVCDGGKLLRPK